MNDPCADGLKNKAEESAVRFKAMAATAAIAMAIPAAAHDFWLQPRGYRFAAPAAVPFSILVGHGAARQPWAVDSDRVLIFRSYGPDGVRDHRGDIAQQEHGGAGVLRLAKPGSYVAVFQSSPAESDLPALRFNDYLAEEGLTPAIEARKAAGTTGRDGRELYSRRAKTLIRVGDAPPATRSYVTRKLGLLLELVPEKDPYALAPGEALPVRVFYRNQPLAGALVKLTNLEFDAKPLSVQRSDAQGRVSFAVPRTGSWLVNVIWTAPVKGNPRADFVTTFSSLSFGYTPGRPG